jgi:hypothetical protein
MPGIVEAQSHLNLAVFILVGIGLLGMAVTTAPLPAGMAALMFLTGFELFTACFEQSVTSCWRCWWSLICLALVAGLSDAALPGLVCLLE